MFLVPMARTSELLRNFDRLFDESFDRFAAPTSAASTARTPALDVAESERAYTVALEMPGVSRDDIKVSIDGRRVSVEASTSKTEEKKDGNRVIYRERSESSFARSFTLPVEVDQAESTAKFDNGVLKLELPKRRAATAKQLPIS